MPVGSASDTSRRRQLLTLYLRQDEWQITPTVFWPVGRREPGFARGDARIKFGCFGHDGRARVNAANLSFAEEACDVLHHLFGHGSVLGGFPEMLDPLGVLFLANFCDRQIVQGRQVARATLQDGFKMFLGRQRTAEFRGASDVKMPTEKSAAIELGSTRLAVSNVLRALVEVQSLGQFVGLLNELSGLLAGFGSDGGRDPLIAQSHEILTGASLPDLQVGVKQIRRGR